MILAWRLVIPTVLLVPDYGAMDGGIAYKGAVNKARCVPALKGVVALHLGCSCRRVCAAPMSPIIGGHYSHDPFE